jgi:hypothetical protein
MPTMCVYTQSTIFQTVYIDTLLWNRGKEEVLIRKNEGQLHDLDIHCAITSFP